MREMTVFTHRQSADTTTGLEELRKQAARAGVTLRFDPAETAKHHLSAGAGVEIDAPVKDDVELCVVLGGDGTILRALQRYADTDVPVFAINYGAIGFLATVEPANLADGVRRALHGEFELLRLPAVVLEPSPEDGASGAGQDAQGASGGGARTGEDEEEGEGDGGPAGTADEGPGQSGGVRAEGRPLRTAINDVAIHRKVGERVAELAYAIDGEEAGSVRCDGLVVATPAGSTGYNLANGGPVMAWGVEGFVVSFIAPHSMSARALVVAPEDRLTIYNRSHEPQDIALDGRPAGEIPALAQLDLRFVNDVGTIAQLPGTSFYRRLREKFGRLAS